jgi:DNA-binding transcriptional ArsR family regulator
MTETLLGFFKAMAHESRLKIVGFLLQGERSVQDLAHALGLKEPTVSHHLAILKAQGLVTARADGTTRWHALDCDALERLTRRVLQPQSAREPHQAPRTAEGFDAKVLKNFVDAEGKLKSIPASRKKRGAVLRWLMRDFATNRAYTESEVNEAIQSHHWDSATLRRELIGHRMLSRKDRIYRRLPEAEWKQGAEM